MEVYEEDFHIEYVVVDYLISNSNAIKYFIIDGEKDYDVIPTKKYIDNKYTLAYKIELDYEIKKKFFESKLKNATFVMLELSSLRLKNGVLHSLESPSFICDEEIKQVLYFIDGISYDYNTWIKHPQMRLAKINTLLK